MTKQILKLQNKFYFVEIDYPSNEIKLSGNEINSRSIYVKFKKFRLT